MPHPPDEDAVAELNEHFRLLYDELHRLASGLMRRERPSHTLATSGLVGELYLRLRRSPGDLPRTQAGLVYRFVREMRSILVDYARYKKRDRRRTPGSREMLERLTVWLERQVDDVLDLEAALEDLEGLGGQSRRAASVVNLRLYAGLSYAEISALTNASVSTLKRDWAFASAWLRGRLSRSTGARN